MRSKSCARTMSRLIPIQTSASVVLRITSTKIIAALPMVQPKPGDVYENSSAKRQRKSNSSPVAVLQVKRTRSIRFNTHPRKYVQLAGHVARCDNDACGHALRPCSQAGSLPPSHEGRRNRFPSGERNRRSSVSKRETLYTLPLLSRYRDEEPVKAACPVVFPRSKRTDSRPHSAFKLCEPRPMSASAICPRTRCNLVLRPRSRLRHGFRYPTGPNGRRAASKATRQAEAPSRSSA